MTDADDLIKEIEDAAKAWKANDDDLTKARHKKFDHALANNSFATCCDILRGHFSSGFKIFKTISYSGKLRYNEMSGMVMVGDRPATDNDVSVCREEIEQTFDGSINQKTGAVTGLKQSAENVRAAMERVARESGYHPLRRYLESLVWDGQPRLESACEELLGAPRTMLNMAIMRCWFLSAVARALEPGCKVDTVLILVGDQGIRKSTWFRALSEPWFAAIDVDVSHPHVVAMLRPYWIIEWAELVSMTRSRSAESVKSYLGRETDSYLGKWKATPEDIPRGFVIAGTTNRDELFTDDTGNRRFWPLPVTNVDLAATRAMRDSLWAEAVALFRGASLCPDCSLPHRCDKHAWYLTGDAASALAELNLDFLFEDPWESPIVSWAQSHLVPFTTSELCDGLGLELKDRTPHRYAAIGSVLRKLGFCRVSTEGSGTGHARTKRWVQKTSEKDKLVKFLTETVESQ